MSENETQENPGGGAAAGTAVKALAAAAVTGAAAYAVQRALSSRNGHADVDGQNDDDDSPESLEGEPETDEDEEDAGDDAPESKEQPEADDEADAEEDEEDEPRSEGDEDVEDDAEDEEPSDDDADSGQRRSVLARRSGGTNKLRLVGSSALAGATPALVPLAGEAASSAGRYVAEHAPDIVTETIVPRFIDGFKKAS